MSRLLKKSSRTGTEPRFQSRAQGLADEFTAYTPKSVMPAMLDPLKSIPPHVPTKSVSFAALGSFTKILDLFEPLPRNTTPDGTNNGAPFVGSERVMIL